MIRLVASSTENCINKINLNIPDPELWTPDNPFLYDVLLELKNGDKTLDKLRGYAGLRKISLGKTPDGFTRLLLNNRFVYQNGPSRSGFLARRALYSPFGKSHDI